MIALYFLAVGALSTGATAQAAQSDGRIVIDTRPALDISSAPHGGVSAFGEAGAATRLSNGTIVLADSKGLALQYVAADGTPLHRAGRNGDGPGEFATISGLMRCGGDSVFVWDDRQHRISVFDPDGRFVRSYQIVPLPMRLACSSTGVLATLVYNPLVLKPPQSTAPILRSVLLLRDRTGAVVGSTDSLDIGRNQLLGPVVSMAWSGDRIFVGTGESASASMFGPDGRNHGARQIGVAGRPVTAAVYSAAERRTLAGFPENMQARFHQMYDPLPRARRLPAYTALFADPDGTLWAVTSTKADSTLSLQAADAAGHALGAVHFAGDFHLFETGRDYLLGMYADATGEQHVAMYRFQLRPGR